MVLTNMTSPSGCSLLGSLNVVRSLWDTLSQVVMGEEQVQGRPLLQDETEEAMGDALAPLKTLLATFQGKNWPPFSHVSFLSFFLPYLLMNVTTFLVGDSMIYQQLSDFCITGTRLVFSREGLQEPFSEVLFFASELQSEFHIIAQQLLVSATAVPDAVAFLQASLGYQVV